MNPMSNNPKPQPEVKTYPLGTNMRIEFRPYGYHGHLVRLVSVNAQGQPCVGPYKHVPYTRLLKYNGEGSSEENVVESEMYDIFDGINSAIERVKAGPKADVRFVDNWVAREVNLVLRQYETMATELFPVAEHNGRYGNQYTMCLHQAMYWYNQYTVRFITNRLGRFDPWRMTTDQEFAALLGEHIASLYNAGLNLDPYAVGKSWVGRTFPVMHTNGRSFPHQVINPTAWCADSKRYAREGYKNAERVAGHLTAPPLVTSEDPALALPKELYPYFAQLRVGFIYTETDMLDAMYVTLEGQKKLASMLVRREVYDVPVDGARQVLRVNRAEPQVVWEKLFVHDERVLGMGPAKINFDFLKGIAQPIPTNAYDAQGRPIDVLIPIRGSKGEVSLFAKMVEEPLRVPLLTQATALEWVEERYKAKLNEECAIKTDVKGFDYRGYTGQLLGFRSGQRHTNLCRVTRVTTDPWYLAMGGKVPLATPKMEAEWQRWRLLCAQTEALISELGGDLEAHYQSNGQWLEAEEGEVDALDPFGVA